MKPARPTLGSIAALAWLALIAAVGTLAPALSSSHPFLIHTLDATGAPTSTASPFLAHLRPIDIALAIGMVLAIIGLVRRTSSPLRRALRATIPLALCLAIGGIVETRSPLRLEVFDSHEHISAGTARATFPLHEFSPNERIAGARVLPPGSALPTADTRTFPLGSDGRGQDVLSQLIHGCRTALLVSLGSALIAMTIGITLGAIMGWFSGWLDTALMRLVEAAMSIPALLVLVVAASVLPRTIGVTILVIGLITWTDAARLTRAEFLRLRDQDFIAAARATGASPWRIIALHLLPSALPPLLVEGSFALAAAILFEASLSFLGLGPAEGASWGRLLAGGLDATGNPLWWITVPAGSLIFLTALSLHTMGDTLRHRLSPSR